MNFNKLDDTEFPILDTVDVYAYKNDYDFKRFDNAQMTIYILNVPWDMGEAHVGQRTITGIGNVVKFENDEARDNWFKSKRYAETPQQYETGNFDGFKWVTKYREFHNGEDLKVPLPFDVVARFNYCWIEYEPAASPEYPVNYEFNGITKWFYFIRNFQWSAVNTTLATIKRDTWQTYINHIKFKGAMLEQGHYPFTLTNVDNYLNNPAANNSGLLAEDLNTISIEGVALKQVETGKFVMRYNDDCSRLHFSDGFLGKMILSVLKPRPVITGKCRACGECGRCCPVQAITVERGSKARVDLEKCIRCYCCQELCPFKAVKIKKTLIGKVVSP